MIRIILADDHNLVRQGIRSLLEKAKDIQIILEVENGQEAVEAVEQHKPDVLITDIAMPRLNGIQAAEQIQSLGLETRVIILSMHSDETLVRQALRIGVKGYLLKRSVTEELLLAVHAAYRDELYLSPAISALVMNDVMSGQIYNEEGDLLDRLTRREREILQLIVEGYTNRSVAGVLGLSIKTVEKHRANVMQKLNVQDLAGLIRVAIKYKLIFIDE